MSSVNWVLESDMFPTSHGPLRDAIRRAGHTIIDWSDDWLIDGAPVRLSSQPTIFHGSLGNAAHVYENFDWKPGSFCDARKFCCSYWYKHYQPWLIHEKYAFTTVANLIENTAEIASSIDSPHAIFVRPDSPLKPFSGRVVSTTDLTPKALDHGFYYDDLQLPIVVAPVRNVGREWRFVVVNNKVITGSGYDATTRAAAVLRLDDSVSDFATSIAAEVFELCSAYVLDIGECDGDLRLMEFNPLSGADLYACDADAIITSVSALAQAR